MKQQISRKEYERLNIVKVIYAKRKGTFDKDLLHKVMITEIEYHLRNNPDLVYIKTGEVKVNADRSRSIPIHFNYRKNVEEQLKRTAEAEAPAPSEPAN